MCYRESGIRAKTRLEREQATTSKRTAEQRPGGRNMPGCSKNTEWGRVGKGKSDREEVREVRGWD